MNLEGMVYKSKNMVANIMVASVKIHFSHSLTVFLVQR